LNTNSLKSNRTSSFLLTAGMAVCLASPTVGHAALLLGTLNISSGSSNVLISTDAINFGPTAGSFDITPSTGTFSTLNGETGLIKNIDNPPYATGAIFATPGFMTFTLAPNITFTLLELAPGTDTSTQCFLAPAPGQNCTPNVPNMAPYNLNNTAGGGSTASFVVFGTEVDSLTNTSVAVVGNFTAQFGTPYQTLLTTVNGGGTITTSYSASFTTVATPEPGTGVTLALGAFGLAGLIGFHRRRTEKQKTSV
jgi:hypothetical protein